MLGELVIIESRKMENVEKAISILDGKILL
jgi:hypothetical protein